jgi:cytochrome c peroxidase
VGIKSPGQWTKALGILIAGMAVSVPVTYAASPPADLTRLGRLMFFDQGLSASGRLACATCHDPKYAYGPPPGKAIASGGPDMTQPGTRAVPSLRYLQGMPKFKEDLKFADGDVGPGGGFTWDGRAASLHEQAKLPLLAPNEMANAGPADVARKLAKAGYARLFRAAFGAHIFDNPLAAFEAGLQALEAFQQVPEEFYPYTSRYDAFLRGDVDLTEQEERGVALFKDPAKGNCASCHLGTTRAGVPPAFTDFDYVNVGVPRNPRIPANSNPGYYDLGLCGPVREDLANRREYCGYFRSPTVRNVAIRDAFFHNGVFSSLREVLNFYNERDLHPEKYYSRNADDSIHAFDDLPPGYPNNIDHDPPLDRRPGDAPALSEADIDALLAFLQTLTDGYTVPRQSATTLDWHKPWVEPQDSVAAEHSSDEYAWRLFVALNWPADSTRRQADSTAHFGADRPVVWETWQSGGNVYLDGGADPGPWRRRLTRPNGRRVAIEDSPERRFETISLRDLPNARHIVNGVMVPLVDPIAAAKRLTEIRMNQPTFDFIRAHELYNVDGQARANKQSTPVSFPYGSKEVKAKWRPITESERSRYHTVSITLADGTRRLYGLTALHIASKDLPTWFWATFEHVDNPALPGNEGWQLPSSDHFACQAEAADCNRPPGGIGLEGTVWQYYRLRGVLTKASDGKPRFLANSEFETGRQKNASCPVCHSGAALDFVWSLSKAGPRNTTPVLAGSSQ